MKVTKMLLNLIQDTRNAFAGRYLLVPLFRSS